MTKQLDTRALAVALALMLTAGCTADTPTAPTAAPTGLAASMARVQAPADVPTGERIVGNAAIEPAYNADSGELMYLLTPIKAPLPSHANVHATSPLYIVEYPGGSTAIGDGHPNCEGVPGNCPDHDATLAGVAVENMPSVYGTDPTSVLGHDHIGDPPGKPDFNVAWEVVEVLFTEQGMSDGAINTRLTTDTAIQAAVDAGDAIEIDLGFAFNCSVVPASLYWRGTPVA
jgi:hypothetical protein